MDISTLQKKIIKDSQKIIKKNYYFSNSFSYFPIFADTPGTLFLKSKADYKYRFYYILYYFKFFLSILFSKVEFKKYFNKNKNFEESFATISLLNKITAEVKTINIKLKENYIYEELKIYAIDCYNSKPLEKVETAVYLNIYNEKSMKKIFNGWMIKSLPSISSMEHPIYDLWVDDCYKL